MTQLVHWLTFLSGISSVLEELYTYSMGVAHGVIQTDAEYERQLAMRLVRRSMDEAASREIAGP